MFRAQGKLQLPLLKVGVNFKMTNLPYVEHNPGREELPAGLACSVVDFIRVDQQTGTHRLFGMRLGCLLKFG